MRPKPTINVGTKVREEVITSTKGLAPCYTSLYEVPQCDLHHIDGELLFWTNLGGYILFMEPLLFMARDPFDGDLRFGELYFSLVG
jgi:hypothetical protein